MTLAPLARILLRYGVGFLLGGSLGQGLAEDGDLVVVLALGLGALIEALYALARKRGWAT